MVGAVDQVEAMTVTEMLVAAAEMVVVAAETVVLAAETVVVAAETVVVAVIGEATAEVMTAAMVMVVQCSIW